MPKTPIKPATISDVARSAGLSRTTVSTALSGNGRLSEETRELVRHHAALLGYEPDFFAQNLRRKRNDLIGFFSPDLDLGVSTHKTQLIWQLLNERGYTVPILAYGDRAGGQSKHQEELFADLRRQKPRAILCNSLNLQSPRAHDELHRYLDEGGIAVCFDWPLPDESEKPRCDSVIFDREENTYTATRHLLELGHREIGLCLPQSQISGGPRLRGFRRAMAEFDAPVEARWIHAPVPDIETEREGARLAQWFFDLKAKPSALCVVGDPVCAAFVTQLLRAGWKLPDQLSLVSHDNRAIAELGMLPLTSVSYPIEEIAQSVVEILDARLRGDQSPPRRHIVRGQIWVRQSARAFQG